VNTRGFTLLELMVGGTIGVMAIAMVLGVFISQTASFQSLDLIRQMNASGRDVSLELGNSIKRAGYGIDPAVAFDFSCPGQPPGTKCHDRYNGTDDLRFYARNPNYVYRPNAVLGCGTAGGCPDGGTIWLINTLPAPSNAQINVTLAAGDVIAKGRTVMAVCPDSTNPHPVYASVTGRFVGPGTFNILIAVNTSTASTSLVAPDINILGCHAGGFLLLVDQYHYYVTTLGTNEPWLVLDTGIDFNNNGTLPPADLADLIPVARGVEDMQVAYQFGPIAGTAPDSNHDWVVGNDQTVAAAEEPDPTQARPLNGTLNGTMHPANIRGVRVTLVVRSPIPDRSLGTVFLGDPAVKFENRSDVSTITLGQFRRMPITLSAATRNMGSANPYLLY
jgi:type IV pilus assembly protein PilW